MATQGNTDNTQSEKTTATGVQERSGNYVSGLYSTPEAASRAYEGLTTTHGYKADDIDVVMSDDTRKKHFGDVTPGSELSGGTKAAEGLGTGAAIGGGIGAAFALLFAGAAMSLPGFNLMIVGPLAAALMGAGAGGTTGGIIGALIGYGIPEDRAKEYERGINEGGILVGTRYRDAEQAKQIEKHFTELGGSNVRY